MKKTTTLAIVSGVLLLASAAHGEIDLSGMTYLGMIDCSPIVQGTGLTDLVYADGELFVTDRGGTVTTGRVYSIGLPAAGDTVASVVRTLGGDNPTNPHYSGLSYIAADDQVHWKIGSAYSLSYAQCEDAPGGNFEDYSGNAPADDRYTHTWGQGVDGRGMTSRYGGNGGGGNYGETPYSWDKYFANQTNHGKMLLQAVPSGSYPVCYDATIGTVFSKLSFLVSATNTYNGDSLRYLEAGEMTWDAVNSKWVVPANSESIVELGSLISEFRNSGDPAIGAGTPKLTVGDGKLYVLNTSTNHIHVLQVPEPATMGLLGLGFAGMAMLRRRRSRRSA